MQLPRWVTRRLWRAVIEFDLLAPGDRVLVGLSGGKDSSFLLYALEALRENAPFRWELAALHVDQGFVPDFNVSPMADLCAKLGVPFFVRRTKISEFAFRPGRQNPCARCSYLRRAYMNDFAVREGYNKVALAHHLDDAVETFLMAQLYSGQLKTFRPRSYLDRCGITVIRPLVYFRENQVKQAGKLMEYEPMDTPCPLAGKSVRARVKALIKELSRENQNIFHNLVVAMRQSTVVEGWPAGTGRKEMSRRVAEFWRGSKQESEVNGGICNKTVRGEHLGAKNA